MGRISTSFKYVLDITEPDLLSLGELGKILENVKIEVSLSYE